MSLFKRFRTGALVVALLLSTSASAQSPLASELPTPELEGYSPVSYFTVGEAQLGKPEFAVRHQDKIFYLTSQAQVDLFKKDPEKYQPRHSVCAFSLAHGLVKPLDPTSFKIVDDTLLLFHVNDDTNAQFEWNKSELSEKELLRRADNNLFLVTF
ncbi:MAG: YHS domain-containing (seleno)protein [Pseudomonadota bacterium]